MKRLANLKNSSSEPSTNGADKQASSTPASKQKSKKAAIAKNNPYQSAEKPLVDTSAPPNGHLSFYTPPSGRSVSYESPSQSKGSLPASSDSRQLPTTGNKSAAPTVSTNPDTVHSEAAASKAGTTTTGGCALSSRGIGGEGSTFSSPAPSVRSLTTTLTTIQSAAPSNFIPGTNHQLPQQATNHQTPHHNAPQFSHQFPTSPPASAIPSHVVPHGSGGHPATYNTATANNLLSDNASILTLASSSKRRRRNSLDTNASVRALAPSSIFGGSRESLPLSVLSAAPGDQSTSLNPLHGRAGVAAIGNPERASVYSSSGIAPALSSERNSYYAKQNIPGDGGSVRSGLINHGRNDSTTGSIGGIASASSPLASPREAQAPGKVSRRNSGWGEVNEDTGEDEEDEQNTKDKASG